MSSKRIQNQNKLQTTASNKQRLSSEEVCHQIAVIIEPQLDKWMSVASRLNTFENQWPYDSVKKARCTSIAVRLYKRTYVIYCFS